MNPSVFLLSDEAAHGHTGKVLAKRAEEICLIQRSRLLIRTTRLNSFFLSPFDFGGVFPTWLFIWISLSFFQARETASCVWEAELQGNTLRYL